MKTGHHRPDGATHGLSHLLVGEAFHISKNESCLLLGREFVHRQFHPFFQLLLEKDPFRSLFSIVGGLDTSFLIQAWHKLFPGLPLMVDRSVHHHSIEISIELGPPSKIFDRSEKFYKNFLNNVKGLLPLSHHTIGNAVDLLMIFFEDLLQRLLISLLTSGDHLGFFTIHCLLTF